jgi:hypothetical protein
MSTGARLGAYQVVAAIGAGGMGEVCGACDTTLSLRRSVGEYFLRILLDAGLFGAGSCCYPSGGGIGAIIGPCVEGNRRAWGSPANSVDDDFE